MFFKVKSVLIVQQTKKLLKLALKIKTVFSFLYALFIFFLISIKMYQHNIDKQVYLLNYFLAKHYAVLRTCYT